MAINYDVEYPKLQKENALLQEKLQATREDRDNKLKIAGRALSFFADGRNYQGRVNQRVVAKGYEVARTALKDCGLSFDSGCEKGGE